jgi:uncharacterized protein (TIGR03492 family)
LFPSPTLRYSSTDRVLCLSNGHGEDVIAVRVLQALQESSPVPQLTALPLVGEGKAYQRLGIPLIGSVKTMPSGGFIYMDGRQFARDIRGGLLQLTLAQVRAIRQWASQGGTILAVGDIFPLLLAWLSGASYAFIGTAKSEYYLRDESGRLFPQTFLDGWSGSVYYPWERWLMSRPRCLGVFPRDSLTTQILQKWNVPAFDLGNPMMDGLEPGNLRAPITVGGQPWGRETPYSLSPSQNSQVSRTSRPRLTRATGLLLPGSRAPEAYENWQQILQAVDSLTQTFDPQPVLLLAAIAANLNLEPLSYALTARGWTPLARAPRLPDYDLSSFSDLTAQWFGRGPATLVLTQDAFGECLHLADWAIAMAGTATEQFVGLGKPAITIPGKGPQFTPVFAEAQTRLLGKSVTLVESPSQVAGVIQELMQNPEQLQQIKGNGQRRMGQPGAAGRIAQCLLTQLRQR